MDRRQKVEVFEQIRRAYEFDGASIRAIAQRLGVHRRMVRQALKDAQPPERKIPVRACPQLAPVDRLTDWAHINVFDTVSTPVYEGRAEAAAGSI